MNKISKPGDDKLQMNANSPVRVLIVDDSPSVRAYLAHIMECAGLTVAGFARNGEEAVRLNQELAPSVVTMDIDMPVMDGFAATRRIMETAPVPIVIVSAHYDKSQVRRTFEALDAGALAILPKPAGSGVESCTEEARELGRLVGLVARARVTRRQRPLQSGVAVCQACASADSCPEVMCAAIGASTGGPQVLREVLASLTPELPFPVVAVQHMAPGFLPGMVEWLSHSSALPVAIATAGEIALPGRVYFAPDGTHLEIGHSLRLNLVHGPRENGVIPAVSRLFRSLAASCGRQSLALLLTGMGGDGAAEFKRLSDIGACVALQSEETCAVFGMPGQARRLGAKAQALSPAELAEFINEAGLGRKRGAR